MKKNGFNILTLWILVNITFGLFLSINLVGLEGVNAQDTYVLSVNVVGSGSVALDPAGGSYLSGTSVSLTASADAGWSFSGWSGDLFGSVNPESLLMDGDKSVTASFTQDEDTTPPTITIISPEEGVTYNNKNVPLEFTVDETVSWMGYSLDGAANITIDTESIIMDVTPKGEHNVTVYANDTAGNMASSILVNFSVQIDEDTSPPTILISSPENITYSVTNIDLNFTVDEATSWIVYSLDGADNITIVENSILTDFSRSLSGLSEGSHSIMVYANDTSGNMGTSSVFFSVDMTPPTIIILSPASSTYATPDISLIFSVNEPSTGYVYNLDGGSNVSISGNSTLTGLSEGNHDLIVYASDNYGNVGTSTTVSFSVQIPVVDTTPPVITVISPQGKTYSTSNVALTFTINEPVTWRAYSLDAAANVTITGNTVLSGLSDGEHTIKIFATDTAGNTGVSNIVTFEIDTAPPIIILSSPEETTYSTPTVFLDFTINEETTWIGYSLDGQDNLTIITNVLLSDLTEGSHTIVVFATDLADNTGASSTVQFTVSIPPVDTSPPIIVINSPANTTYSNSTVFLDFGINEPVSWIGYSLDGGDNVTITGDTVLSDLSEGSHSIVVFATDLADNTGASSTVQFTVSIPPVDTSPPIIVILSPENTTYEVSFVLLDIFVNEPISWIGYSLDGVDNVTITGDTVLSGLSEGSHSIIVFATDRAGNTGASTVVQFTFTIPLPDTTIPTVTVISPNNTTYSVSTINLNFTVDEETSWIGYSLDGQNNVTIFENTPLTDLSDGLHSVVVYANDTAGNMGMSNVVYFSVDTTPPVITIISPEATTYTTTNVDLIFTVDEETSWIGYSLDGQNNVTIVDPIVLTNLADGEHTLIIFAEDLNANIGTSNFIIFRITIENEINSQLWVVAVIAIIAVVGFIFSIYIAYDLYTTRTK